MTKSFKCASIGQDCEWSARANNVYDLMQKISWHAEHKHNMTKITEELKEKIKISIKDY